MGSPGAKVVPSSIVASSRKVNSLKQGPSVGVGASVTAGVGVGGKGVGVGLGCVGGIAVGGRKGVGVD